MQSEPILSIITVHFDDFKNLKYTWEATQSILSRGGVEWIVIDGNSKATNDFEREILNRVEQESTIYLSEPDDGIYAAMNKGIKLATGTYFLFLNAGDRLSPEFSLEKLRKILGDFEPEMVWGNTNYQYADNQYVVKKLRKPSWMIYGMPVCHQSVLFLTERFRNLPYDVHYKIAADYDLLARAIKAGADPYIVDEIFSEYSAGGVSQSDRWLSLTEENEVRINHYSVPGWLGYLIKVIKLGFWKANDFSPAFNRLWRKHF